MAGTAYLRSSSFWGILPGMHNPPPGVYFAYVSVVLLPALLQVA